MRTDVEVSMSNRHAHLTAELVEALFGEGYELHEMRKVGVREFASQETITAYGPKGKVADIRVMGPPRSYCQIELLMGDTYKLGIEAVLCDSGHVDNAADLVLEGPAGKVAVPHCGIVARRHLHLGQVVADQYEVKVGDIVSVRVGGERGVIFNNVIVRSGRSDRCKFHIDVEEGNAAGLRGVTRGEIVSIDERS
ncbi:MAG: propanediol utilization protein [Lachnospiraceae bacterium]|nr:propanediol utilization protein [Lachnospiraceae bacterium]